MTTYSKSGSFGWAGGGKGQATVDMWLQSRFPGQPAQNAAPPSGSPDGGPVTTGPTYGSPGAFTVTVTTIADYYLRIQYGGQSYWSAVPANDLAGAPVASGVTDVTGDETSIHVVNGTTVPVVSLKALTGDITTSAGAVATTLKNTGTAGSKGSASAVPVFTTDAQGRVTANTNTNIAIAESQVTNLTTDLAAKFATPGAWTSFTPAWAASGTQPVLGNGSLVGAYQQIGKLVAFRASLVTGTTTTYGTGSYLFALPLTSVSGIGQICQVLLNDETHIWNGVGQIASSSGSVIPYTNSGGTSGSQQILGASQVTTAGQLVWIQGVYEVA